MAKKKGRAALPVGGPGRVASTGECTGSIPAAPADGAETGAYSELLSLPKNGGAGKTPQDGGLPDR